MGEMVCRCLLKVIFITHLEPCSRHNPEKHSHHPKLLYELVWYITNLSRHPQRWRTNLDNFTRGPIRIYIMPVLRKQGINDVAHQLATYQCFHYRSNLPGKHIATLFESSFVRELLKQRQHTATHKV